MQAITLFCCRTLLSSWAVEAHWPGLLQVEALLHKLPAACLLLRWPWQLLTTYFFGWSASCQWGEWVLGILSAYSHGCALLSWLSSRRCWRSRGWLLWCIQLWHGHTCHVPMGKPLSWQVAPAPAASAVFCSSAQKLEKHTLESSVNERSVYIHLSAFCDSLRVFSFLSALSRSQEGTSERELHTCWIWT